MQVVRAGSQWTVHWAAFRRYRGKLRERFDVVIDQVNTVPFLTPLWADIPHLMFIHQLAREVWWYEMRFPLNALGFVLEPLYLAPYHHTPIVTISESTRKDLRRLRFKGTIRVIPVGIEPLFPQDVKKAVVPTFIYVGRLAPSKRLSDIIRAFDIFNAQTGTARLLLVGAGDSRHVSSLRLLVESLGIHDQVEFMGRLPLAQKQRQVAQATGLLMASVREGWGLVISEANALGTPAVVYDVPGLRDSVLDGETGLIVPASPGAMANAMLRLWHDRALYDHVTAGARASSKKFSFDKSVASMIEEISSHLTPSQRSMETVG